MKIVQVFNLHRSGGGANIATLGLIDLLKSHGLEVAVFARSSASLSSSALSHIKAASAAFCPGQSVDEFCALLDTFKPDLVHAHELFPLVSPWILPHCTRRGIPIVMTCNDYHLTCPARNHVCKGIICKQCSPGNVLPSIYNNCRGNLAESIVMAAYCSMVNRTHLYINNVAHYIAPSTFTAQWLVESLNISSAKVTAVPTQVPVPTRSATPSKGQHAAFAGRFVAEKGIHIALGAAERSGVPLWLSRNRSSFVEVELPPEYTVVVTDTRSELESFYLESRMVVVPSVWFETFGLVAAEAMALGIPVIASRIGALAELIEDGVDGLLFEPGNICELAEKMKLLWFNPILADQLGSRAREKAKRLWSPEQHFAATCAVYKNVLTSASERSSVY